jgi:hypothetical protein
MNFSLAPMAWIPVDKRGLKTTPRVREAQGTMEENEGRKNGNNISS